MAPSNNKHPNLKRPARAVKVSKLSNPRSEAAHFGGLIFDRETDQNRIVKLHDLLVKAPMI
jgi:hypothetical protein